MIGLLLGIPSWSLWAALGLVAVAGCVLLYLSAGRLSNEARMALVAAAGVVLLVIGVQSALKTAKAEGKAECEAAHAAAVAEWERKAAEQARAADQADLVKRDTYETDAAPIRERIIREVATRADGSRCLSPDAERLLEDQAGAANRQIAAATGRAGPGVQADTKPEG